VTLQRELQGLADVCSASTNKGPQVDTPVKSLLGLDQPILSSSFPTVGGYGNRPISALQEGSEAHNHTVSK
jgi:hypothetical protein